MLEAPRGTGIRKPPALSDGATLVVVGVLSALLHAVAVAAGVRVGPGQLRAGYLSTVWQLLPARLLRHDLVASLAHLHSQPPLFNLFTGVLLELPRATQAPAANLALFACSVALAVATAGLLLEFRVKRWLVVTLVTVFVLADPAQYLYAGIFFYAVPTAAIATTTGWAAVRWARTQRWTSGVCFGVLSATLILTNSSFQLYTVAIAMLPILWVLRRKWREVLAVLVVPLLAVSAWYVNDVVQFRTLTTSSWLGMNLARSTLELANPQAIERQIRDGTLSPLARIRPFSPLRAYGPLGQHARTGHPALDQRVKLASPNYNNIAYVTIARRYLTDDLSWIRHNPLEYLRHTTVGLRMWMLPAGQFYATVQSPHYRLGGYTTLYDTLVQLQLSAAPYAVVAVIQQRVGPTPSNLSLVVVLETILAVGVLPFAIWRRRRDASAAAGAATLWLLVTSVFVATTLIEAAENNRFRFELGGLPLVAATVAVAWIFDRSGVGGGLLRGAGGERDGSTREALAVDDEAPRVAAARDQGERPEVDGHGDVDG